MLSIPHLGKFWSRQMEGTSEPEDWSADNTLLSGLRVGLQETFAFLQSARPTLEQFEQWIVAQNGGTIEQERIDRINAALRGELDGEHSPFAPALTAGELESWDDNGYVVLREAVTAEAASRAAAAVYEFLKADPDTAETWYSHRPEGRSIWVPFLHHPALLDNRDSPRIHAAFAQLWNRSDLWMNTDQCGFNPPERSDWLFQGQGLHWDVSLELPVPFGTQALLYLTDTPPEQGAFQCVPGFHRVIEEWLMRLPSGMDPRSASFTDKAIPVAGRAGDLVIWHHALPHGASPNRGRLPRVVQYMNMRPSTWEFNPIWR